MVFTVDMVGVGVVVLCCSERLASVQRSWGLMKNENKTTSPVKLNLYVLGAAYHSTSQSLWARDRQGR